MPSDIRATTRLLILLLLCLLTAPLFAQEEAIQPQLRLHLPEAPAGASPNVVALSERINGDLLRRLNEENRFAISLGEPVSELEPFFEGLVPPEGTDLVVAGVLEERRDGSYRFLFDVWSARLERVTYSQEFDARGLPVMGNEDAILLLSREIQGSLEEAVLELFPGFAWLVFENRGAAGSYEVVIDGVSVGVNLQEISLLPGQREIEILQEIEEEVYIMAQEQLNLEVGDYYQVVFELASEPPEIPGFLRIERTADDWKVGLEFGYDYLIPITSLSERLFNSGHVVMTRIIGNDLPMQDLILGIDGGLGFFSVVTGGSVDAEHYFIPLLGFLGYRFGPLGGVDFTLKAAGGVQLALVEYTPDESIYGGTPPIQDEQIIPTMRTSAEFGFNWGRYVRFYGGTNLWNFFEEAEVLTFIGLHFGFGFKF